VPRKKDRKRPRGTRWTPFQQALLEPGPFDALLRRDRPFTIYMNNLYQVAVYRDDPPPATGWPRMIHLSIKRRDRKAVHDWRHLQRIKDELVGPEHDAVEIYPAASRLIDTSNQYHLWVIAEEGVRFPVGFQEGRLVSEGNALGSVQRPFEDGFRPPDCKTETDETLQATLDAALKKGDSGCQSTTSS